MKYHSQCYVGYHNKTNALTQEIKHDLKPYDDDVVLDGLNI